MTEMMLLMFNTNGDISHNGRAILLVNGISVDYTAIGAVPVGVPVHFYIVWDNTAGLADGKTVRVFINGTEMLSTTTAVTNLDEIVMQYRQDSTCVSDATIMAGIDNLKIYKEVVTESPDWEYNGGTGRENALHFIYGAAFNYHPLLTGGASGVGYLYYEQL